MPRDRYFRVRLTQREEERLKAKWKAHCAENQCDIDMSQWARLLLLAPSFKEKMIRALDGKGIVDASILLKDDEVLRKLIGT